MPEVRPRPWECARVAHQGRLLARAHVRLGLLFAHISAAVLIREVVLDEKKFGFRPVVTEQQEDLDDDCILSSAFFDRRASGRTRCSGSGD